MGLRRYKYFYTYGAGIYFSRQNLMSTNVSESEAVGLEGYCFFTLNQMCSSNTHIMGYTVPSEFHSTHDYRRYEQF